MHKKAAAKCQEDEKQGIPQFEWMSNSLDFNPIECIWSTFMRRTQWSRASERVTTLTEVKTVLVDEWENFAMQEINTKIEKLPTVIPRCLKVNGRKI